MNENKLIENEIRGCFDFFWNESNGFTEEIKGYGLTLDKSGKKVASLAAVGFALCAYIIGIERKYISYEEGKLRTVKTLLNVRDNIEHKNGFLIHFADQETGENYKESEYSTIDTAILLMGAITAGEYFRGDVYIIAEELMNRTDFEWLIDEKNGKKLFSMSYDKRNGKEGFSTAKWDHYAEQLMMYILYAGKKNTNPELARELYYGFERNMGSYKGENYVYSFSNALFIHQFTHCFFNFKDYVDQRGFDWFSNSMHATLANRQYCMDQTWSKTYNQNSWGLTAFQGKNGYQVYGGPPTGYDDTDCEMTLDGSVASYAPLSSICFTPKESIEHLRYIQKFPELFGKYGITDSYNLENEPYFSKEYLGIDKGPTLIMLENYLTGTIWKYFMRSDIAERAIEVLKFQKRDFKNFFYIKK